MRLHWHIHSSGADPAGRQFFVIDISDDNVGPGHRTFAAVLMLEDRRLWRLRSSGRKVLLATDFAPLDLDLIKRHDEEAKLRPVAPKAWGSQRGCMCVHKALPTWVLKRSTANPARLLLAWLQVDKVHRQQQVLGLHRTPDLHRAEVRPWDRARPAPAAVTSIPSTDVVVRTLNSGTLLQRLQRGLERIYVSEMTLIRAPKHRPALTALAKRFSDRLVIVPLPEWDAAGIVFRHMTRVRAFEYATVGLWLRDQYLDDFGYDKWENPDPDPFPDMMLRVGDIPRGAKKLLWAHEWIIPFEMWATLDERGLKREAAKAELVRRGQTKRAQDALATAFTGNHERGVRE